MGGCNVGWGCAPADGQASILVRALVHGWRHMGGAHTPVEGVGVAVVSGLDS